MCDTGKLIDNDKQSRPVTVKVEVRRLIFAPVGVYPDSFIRAGLVLTPQCGRNRLPRYRPWDGC